MALVRSRFDPAQHGFRFRNGSFKFHVGLINCTVLCGGMSYAALDYFYYGLEIPSSDHAPAELNPLQSYLYDRQMTAHQMTVPLFVNSWISPPFAPNLITETSFGHLESMIGSRKQPVVICLFGRRFVGHHVLAIGCDRATQTIKLYNSNFPYNDSYPGQEQCQIQYVDGRWKHTPDDGHNWAGWFIDPGYYAHSWPQKPLLSWRWCRKCSGLFTLSFAINNYCPIGGQHQLNHGCEYFLPWKEGEGDPGWFACEQCQGLYKPGDPSSQGPCAGPGNHVPKKWKGEVLTFRVMQSGPGEPNWRRCKNCSLLYRQGTGPAGTCSVGIFHEPEFGPSYTVDCRT